MLLKATTIEEQMSILQKRNMILDESAYSILLQYGYYNLVNGYKDAFLDKDKSNKLGNDYYRDGTTLKQVLVLYEFDDMLRKNLLNCITHIETQMKSLVSLHFSLRYGTNHWTYLTPASFTDRPRERNHVYSLIMKLTRDINLFYHKKPHPAICHFMSKYREVPLWGLNTVMSFGTMATFYDLLVDDLKKTIAHGVHPEMTPRLLSGILYYLTGIRNKCAHSNRLYTHKIDQRALRSSAIPALSIHEKLGIPRKKDYGMYEQGQDDILAAFIAITVFFGQTHIYEIKYDNVNKSLLILGKSISPEVETYVRNMTGLQSEYLSRLANLNSAAET